MSAFMHTNKHLSACAINAAPLLNIPAAELFRLWRAANARSIFVRYGDKGLAKRCGPLDTTAPLLTPEQLVTALNSLYYQSCEYPGWKQSRACVLLMDALRELEKRGVKALRDAGDYWWIT